MILPSHEATRSPDEGNTITNRRFNSVDVTSIASTPSLLVACDYDGTIAPIVDDPLTARPVRESIVALRSLAALPDTHVAVVSGRSLRDLAALSRLPPEVHLVGSHGSEFDPDFASRLDAVTKELTSVVQQSLEAIALRTPGATVERKPAGAAFHYRMCDSADVPGAVDAVLDGPARIPGVHIQHGKSVIDISAIATDKGSALDQLRHLVGATAVIFVGDDTTDESAFATLSSSDVAVKVGHGPTIATRRVPDPEGVALLLADLFERRRSWLEGGDAPPIERHTLLSDQRALALLTVDGRINWMCHPRADSPPLFADLLGGPTAGFFSVRPVGDAAPLGQRYAGNSLIAETTWAGLRVTDYFDASQGRAFQAPGLTTLLRVLEGDTEVIVEFAPRPDFGRASTRLEVCDGGVVVLGSPAPIRLLAAGVTWRISNDDLPERAVATIELERGRPVVLELCLGEQGTPPAVEPERRRATHEHWSTWCAALNVPTMTKDLVRRSALTVKAMCHQPSGAILAAATTSLPEVIGGSRNWDYRYCWPRDAAIAADSLVRLGSLDEGLAFVAWLGERLAGLQSADSLRPLYPLSGDEFSPEAVIPTLHGYRGSRPVRIGNLAEHQLQLDMFGPIVQLVRRLVRAGATLTDRQWDLVRLVVDAVARRWEEPDHGIWELRGQPRHHVHSKMMCWAAVDSGWRIAEESGRSAPAAWSAVAEQIRADVLERGWNPRIGSFSAVYGEDQVDASLLNVALVGILPADDPRVIATVAAVERRLRRGGVVQRYLYDDGLPGREGGFLLCSAWLIEAMVATGRGDDARELFRQYVTMAGHTGLFAEQYEPDSEIALGNFPQVYSHAGLINAALALDLLAPTGEVQIIRAVRS